MANITIKDFKFPRNGNTYSIPQVDDTLSTAGKAADAKKTGDELDGLKEDLNELNSNFADMESDGVVPSAEQIISDKYTEDKVPYHYRKTGGDGADRLYDQIVGGTVCWNQLVKNGNFESVSGWLGTYTVNNNVGTFTLAKFTSIRQAVNITEGHKYIVAGTINGESGKTVWLNVVINGVNNYVSCLTTGTFATYGGIKTYASGGSAVFHIESISEGNATISAKNIMFIDLTAMFGSTIADYIYSLETAHAGDGVAFFKSLFPNDYYPYDAGTLKSVEGLSEHKMVGFNQWDEQWDLGDIDGYTGEYKSTQNYLRSKNLIPVLPNTTYYLNIPSLIYLYEYDADENAVLSGGVAYHSILNSATYTTGANTHYIAFRNNTNSATQTYGHDICINISDPAKNGQYKPYEAHSYPLDDSLTLRGLFKLDANNSLYADGDTYEYTGKVTRNTILRAYQSGDESLANAITDGTNTVVYSANASTEQAEPYQRLQQCDPSGTEEYVNTGIVPVGHNSFYPENLKAKIEGLPWNFASLIAPTESTYTATRNYTTGALFIVNNVLYKATANIANGGTITPNTNCTATTLAEIISTLA